ncbi:MAG: DUF1223 domain-containing protein [Polyangiaceae bacterium]
MRAVSSAAATVVAVVAVVAASLGGCRSRSSPVPEARADDTPVAAPASDAVAVVELFTSEGCSSCPPADDVLGDLARSPAAGRSLFPLAFHVDYWDDLGWPDRFASPDFTARQRLYARAFGARGLYTPQMIVGGTEQFTGSDRDHADAAIARELARPAPVHLALRARKSGSGQIAVDWTASGAPAGEVLNLALVEASTSTAVRAGENAGRTLRHANVVRSFLTVPLTQPSGAATLPAPGAPLAGPGAILAYGQRGAVPGAGMPIDGATSTPLPE